jgi:hypothetical protein
MLSDFERLLAAEVAGRDHLLAATQFVAILDAGHRATIRRPADGPNWVERSLAG